MSRTNPPFFRRTRASEKRDVYHAACRERVKRAGGGSHAQQVARIVRMAIENELDQLPGTVY